MSKLSLPEVMKAYKIWVQNNPNLVTDAETVVTWSSYFVAGKINNSPIVSELVYSLSKLLSLYNDKILREAYSNELQYFGTKEKIKTWLTVIHYCEVLMELVVRKKYGSRGKWTTAVVLQIMKCAANLILLYKFREIPIQHPPVPMLQRKKFLESQESDENRNGYFTLKRSGRVIRNVEGAPPVAFRDWQPLKMKEVSENPNVNIKSLIYAETMHCLKPIVHLASLQVFGTRAWKQWLISLSLDLASLKLYEKYMKDLSQEQQLEVSRRKLALLLYLLRSPLYDRFSKNMIEGMLTSASNKIPMAGFICNPVLQYLNHWQDMYFYMWAS